MAAWNWEDCLAHTKISEGGYVNDPVDPGGETKYGISDRRDGRVDGMADLDGDGDGDIRIVNLTQSHADAIYKRDYWDAVSGDDLPSGLDLVAFDAAVNSGVSRGAKWLQRALGVKQDGRIGPQTIKAALECEDVEVITAACEYRLSFMQSLKTWYRYKNGWTARVNGVKSEAIRMTKADFSEPKKRGFDLIGWLVKLIMGMFKR